MAQSFGYKPKLSTASTTNVNIFQTVPAVSEGSGATYKTKADLSYASSVVAETTGEIIDDSEEEYNNSNYLTFINDLTPF